MKNQFVFAALILSPLALNSSAEELTAYTLRCVGQSQGSSEQLVFEQKFNFGLAEDSPAITLGSLNLNPSGYKAFQSYIRLSENQPEVVALEVVNDGIETIFRLEYFAKAESLNLMKASVGNVQNSVRGSRLDCKVEKN